MAGWGNTNSFNMPPLSIWFTGGFIRPALLLNASGSSCGLYCFLSTVVDNEKSVLTEDKDLTVIIHVLVIYR